MAAITVAARPISIDGCFSSWSEMDKPQIIRSEMDFGTIKVRRRTTSSIWTIEASVVLKAELYDDFQTWFRVNCQAGVLPTRIKRPQDGKELVARFTEAPTISWPELEKGAFQAACKFEQLPEWRTL